jgi:hypothetical protein
LACGITEGSTCEECRRAWEREEEARWPHLRRAGPEPWNQIAPTLEEQFARVFRDRPNWLTELLREQADALFDMLKDRIEGQVIDIVNALRDG